LNSLQYAGTGQFKSGRVAVPETAKYHDVLVSFGRKKQRTDIVTTVELLIEVQCMNSSHASVFF